MKIKSVKIKNFRSYEEETELNFNDLTVLVGINPQFLRHWIFSLTTGMV